MTKIAAILMASFNNVHFYGQIYAWTSYKMNQKLIISLNSDIIKLFIRNIWRVWG